MTNKRRTIEKIWKEEKAEERKNARRELFSLGHQSPNKTEKVASICE